MKIDILSITPDIEKHIELCGRTCYQSLDKITDDSAAAFIKMIINNGHESVLEHGAASFRVSGISRACSHQLVRHRVASYSQQSQRYVKFDCEDGAQFPYVCPPSIMAMAGTNNYDLYREYHSLMDSMQWFYTQCMKRKACKAEDARYVLPNACETEIVITMNMREYRHTFRERLAPAAQWEIRDMCKELLVILKEKAPTIFSDF